MKIAVSILFDAQYLEPALVTAFELIQRARNFRHIYLIYLAAGSSVDNEAAGIISKFCSYMGGEAVKISAITLQDTLPSFQAAHFNNSIIYKALLPSMLNHENFVLNVDAGILVGERFDVFIREITDTLCTLKCATWLISAHCSDPANLLPSKLKDQKHNTLYPAGGLLLFNMKKCREANWVHRLLSNYHHYAPSLQYAEQELICLTAEEGELLALPGADDRYTPFLGLDAMFDQSALLQENCANDCLFFKFVGTLKPWKYWVLDPNKIYWTRRRDLLEQVFPLGNFDLIESYRHAVNHERYRLAFLKQYDSYLHKIALQY